VLPFVPEPERLLTIAELTPQDELLREVAEYLERHRVIGTSAHVMPVPLRAVTIVADVIVSRGADTEAVRRDIEDELYRFINPLVGGSADGPGEGWGFGRPLNEGELYALVHEVPGVHRIVEVGMYETDLETPKTPEAQPEGARVVLAPNELLCSAIHRVRTRHLHHDGD
jgi:Baseplate J-like protein